MPQSLLLPALWRCFTRRPSRQQQRKAAKSAVTPTQLEVLSTELCGDENVLPRAASPIVTRASAAAAEASSTAPILGFHTPPKRRRAAKAVTDVGSIACLSPTSTAALAVSPKRIRRVPRAPVKVLDAPRLADDFYLNLVHWSSLNCVAVGLSSIVYSWNANTASVEKVADTQGFGSVSSVQWSRSGKLLAVGTTRGVVSLRDAETGQEVRRYVDHKGRVAVSSWSATTLATGCKDGSIRLRDVRSPTSAFQELKSHAQEVCGLAWSPDSRFLASGGNDNRLLLWDACSLRRAGQSPTTLTKRRDALLDLTAHRAAVKALAWSPHQAGVLASGGGTADKTIRLWNVLRGTETRCVQTASQVCALGWSTNVDELISTHGFSANEIAVWRHEDMRKVAALTGHTFRVLYLALSPDGQTAVTGAGDETLRFWHVFPPGPGQGDATALPDGSQTLADTMVASSPARPSRVTATTISAVPAPGTPQRSLAAMR